MRVVRDDKFVEGRDGFLFMANDNNRVVDQHTGALRLDAQQLEAWRVLLERRTELLAARDCAHVVMVAPDAHSLYPEKLPEGMRSVRERPVHHLMAHLEDAGSAVRPIYPLDEMLAEKADRLVASPVDSHWTEYGAFVAFLRLMDEVRQHVATRPVGPRDVLFTEVDTAGDLGDKLDPPRTAPQPFGRMRYRTARLVYDNCVEGTGAFAIARCPPAPDVTCLMLGDSYAYWILRYISESFRWLALHHAPTLDPGVVDAVDPDIVVNVIAERFLVEVPDDERGASLRAREEQKRASDRVRHPLLHWTWPRLLAPSAVELMRSRLLARGALRDVALIGVVAYAGLRPAEAARLRWSAVREDAILVEPLPRRRAAGASARRVPLWAPLAHDLEAWRRESGGSGNRLVFSARGQPWSLDLRSWRRDVYPALAREAGMQDERPSALRHVYCALQINAGLSAEELAPLVDDDPEELVRTFKGLFEEAAGREPDPPEEVIRVTREVPAA